MTNALNPQEAFEKYFGTAKELAVKPYPWKCNHCPFLLMHLDSDWQAHVRNFHNEKILSQKQIDRAIQREKDKQEKESKPTNPFASI